MWLYRQKLSDLSLMVPWHGHTHSSGTSRESSEASVRRWGQVCGNYEGEPWDRTEGSAKRDNSHSAMSARVTRTAPRCP